MNRRRPAITACAPTTALKPNSPSALRAGLAQFRFPAQSPATLLIRAGSSVSVSGNEVSGYRHTAIGGGKRPYTIYFSARFEQPFQSVRTWKSNDTQQGDRSQQPRIAARS